LHRTKRDELGRFCDQNLLREAVDTARTFGILLLEQFERKSEKYAEQKAKFDDLCGRAKGATSFAKKERKTFEILGMSAQYPGKLLFRKNENGKNEWFLGLNCANGEQSPSEAKKCKPNFFGFDHEGVTLPVLFDETQPHAILIPLAFSKHQAQEFLWNRNRSLLDQKMKICNARIICEENDDGKKYSVALAMQKLLKTDAPKKWNPKNWLGIDRGEVIPAAAVLTSADGAEILDAQILGKECAAKQKLLAREESKKQKLGKSVVGHRAKNISDGMLGEITREILNLATNGDAKIVLENLSRGFGMKSRKRTPLSAHQYTKIVDRLKEKIEYEGMDFQNWCDETFANYTSKTCSRCGFVHAWEFCKKLAEDFVDFEDGKNIPTEIALANGKTFVFPEKISFKFWNFKKGAPGKVEISPREYLAEILEKHGVGTQVRFKKLSSAFGKILNYRPTQDVFRCQSCGFETNADLQAGLNIARMKIFQNSKEYQKYRREKDAEKNPSFPKFWMNFYEKMIAEKNWKCLPEKFWVKNECEKKPEKIVSKRKMQRLRKKGKLNY